MAVAIMASANHHVIDILDHYLVDVEPVSAHMRILHLQECAHPLNLTRILAIS